MKGFKVVFQFRNEYGWWIQDSLDGNGEGLFLWEAEQIKAHLATVENVKNVRIESMEDGK